MTKLRLRYLKGVTKKAFDAFDPTTIMSVTDSSKITVSVTVQIEAHWGIIMLRYENR